MSICSITSSATPPRAAVSRNGYRFDTTQVERLDTELGQLPHVVGLASVGEQTGVHLRVQRLHPAFEALGKTGEVFDLQHRDPGLGQHSGRRSGRHDLHAGGRSPRPSSTMLVLSYTLMSARLIGRRPSVASASMLTGW